MNRKKVEEYSILLKDSAAILPSGHRAMETISALRNSVYTLSFPRSAADLCTKSTGNCLCDICPVEEDWTLCQEWRTQYCVA